MAGLSRSQESAGLSHALPWERGNRASRQDGGQFSKTRNGSVYGLFSTCSVHGKGRSDGASNWRGKLLFPMTAVELLYRKSICPSNLVE